MGNSQGRPGVVSAEDVCLDHFKLLRIVGKGAFGKVRIVERKDSGLTFALKYIRKDGVVRAENVKNIIRERKMLEHLNHPFLCNLRYSFQDFEYMYLVVDLMTGGDLRFHIDRRTYTEEAIRFWIAELGCAVRYIHDRGIIHRDIKPDNILLDAQGHVHLADFNVASEATPGKLLTSKSGTLAYLAPEVYEGKGYSYPVDWWSVGVVLYECIYSKRPFAGSTEKELAATIIRNKAPYPQTSPPVSRQALDAMQSLMCDRRIRIGAVGFQSFTAHPFFAPIDFSALEKKLIAPVFRPSSEKPNFDATHDLEELLLEEAPLEARVKRNKPRAQPKAGATAREIRTAQLYQMIEQMFEPFDYTQASYDNSAPVQVSLPIDAVTEGEVSSAQMERDGQSSQGSVGHATPPLTSQTSRPTLNRGTSGSSGTFYHAPSSEQGTASPSKRTPSGASGAASVAGPALPGPAAVPSRSRGQASSSRPVRSPMTRSRSSDNTRVTVDLPPASRDPRRLGYQSASSDLATRSAEPRAKPPGILGFFSKKKGADRLSKGNKERGVLGKEGARVPVSKTD